MVLPIKDSDFLDSLTYLISCPDSLIVGAKKVISSHEHIDGHIANGRQWHVWCLTMCVILHVIRRVLLKALLDTVLEHMLKSLH